LIEKILTADPTDNPVDIDSLLIARHGNLVIEGYFHGFDKERPHDMRSASKTFAPILAGIARDRSVNLSSDTPIYPLFLEDEPFPHWDARKSHVPLKALMTMTSGFACDDNNDTSPGNEGKIADLNLAGLRIDGGRRMQVAASVRAFWRIGLPRCSVIVLC